MRSTALLALAALLGAPALGETTPVAAPAAPPVSLIAPALNIASPEREIAFYRDGIGMALAMTLNGGHGTEYMLSFGGDPGQAGIILQNDPAAKTPLTQGSAFNRLVLRVADIDAMALRLDHAHYPHSPIRDVGHGYRMMTATDPEGYRLELVQRGTTH